MYANWQQLEQALCIKGAHLSVVELAEEHIKLALLQLENPHMKMHAAQIAALWQQLPYWAFAWAGGRALVRWINAHPEAIKGKRILDFGCGSAMVAIAAAKAGASEIWVADLDHNALLAAKLNAQLNQVAIQTVDNDCWPEVDVLLASDVLYDISSSQDLRQLMLQVPEWYLAESQYVKPDFVQLQSLQHYQCSTLPRIGDFDEQVAIEIYTRKH